jgi:hypothetical protein
MNREQQEENNENNSCLVLFALLLFLPIEQECDVRNDAIGNKSRAHKK